ncbi:MAG TPA: TlpA disulfide reductase family protein [Gemmatimonadaceae bacterium]|nr:TlpA disulfide reductase family protein [Gemmatimonadaceae bacterium]
MTIVSMLSRGTLVATLIAGAVAPRTTHAQSQGLQVGDMAPTAVVQTLDGDSVDLARFVGKTPVLIEFWATWCPLCKQLEPTIKELHHKYDGQLEIVHLVVPQNQTPERAREYVRKHGLPGHFFFDAEGAAYKAFAAYHTSYIVVLDRSGVVVHSADGPKQDLDAAVARAVRSR